MPLRRCALHFTGSQACAPAPVEPHRRQRGSSEPAEQAAALCAGAAGAADGFRLLLIERAKPFARARGERGAGCAGLKAGRYRDILIVGLGVDIAEVDRLQAAIERRGESFLKRVFTPAEIAYCERHRAKFERYAARFAAKEAAMKALGTGWGDGVRWVDLEVTRDNKGKPTMVLAGRARAIADAMGVRRISLSLTHSGNTAFAQVIFEN